MKTVKDLIEHCKTALKNRVQYIYGAKMKVMSYDEIKSLQNMYGKDCVWDSDLNKAGKLCCDCSGLISSCTGPVRNSENYEYNAPKKDTIANLNKNWENYVGWALWMPGHIGVVSEKPGYYYAMDGSGRNMVLNPMSMQGWQKVIKIVDLDYSTPYTNEPYLQGVTIENLHLRASYYATSQSYKVIPKGAKVIIKNAQNQDWYRVEYDGVTGFSAAEFISKSQNGGNGKNAVNRLAFFEVMKTPEYWLKHYDDISYLEILIVNSALFITSKEVKNKIGNYNQALEMLVKKGVIKDKLYWEKHQNDVKYLKELVINIAKRL